MSSNLLIEVCDQETARPHVRLRKQIKIEEFIRSPLAEKGDWSTEKNVFWLRREKKRKERDKGVRQQFVSSLYSPLQPAFADDTYTASADDTTLLTSFTPPSHSYKLFLTLHKIPYVN